jgi:hypothetical protein
VARRHHRESPQTTIAGHSLAYFGRLDLAVPLMRDAYPRLRASLDLMPEAVEDFAGQGVDLELCRWLEDHPDAVGDEPGLLDRVRYYDPEEEPD